MRLPTVTPPDMNPQTWRWLLDVLNGGLSIDNFAGAVLDFTSHGTPNTEVAVPHTLKRVPKYYLVLRQDKAGSVYLGSTAWTHTNLYLKSDTATMATRLLVL